MRGRLLGGTSHPVILISQECKTRTVALQGRLAQGGWLKSEREAQALALAFGRLPVDVSRASRLARSTSAWSAFFLMPCCMQS